MLHTTASATGAAIESPGLEYSYGCWGWWYFDRIEYGDESVVFFARDLPAGTYQFTYHLQAVIPGEYQVIPATAREEFFPEVFGRSDGMIFTILEESD